LPVDGEKGGKRRCRRGSQLVRWKAYGILGLICSCCKNSHKQSAYDRLTMRKHFRKKLTTHPVASTLPLKSTLNKKGLSGSLPSGKYITNKDPSGVRGRGVNRGNDRLNQAHQGTNGVRGAPGRGRADRRGRRVFSCCPLAARQRKLSLLELTRWVIALIGGAIFILLY